MNGSKPELLTTDPGDHEIKSSANQLMTLMKVIGTYVEPNQAGFSSSGDYFIDSVSSPDIPAVISLYSKDGNLVSTLATQEISDLYKENHPLPEPFETLAADGKTKIYGNMYRPSHFDPQKKYPLLDNIYCGPQVVNTAKRFLDNCPQQAFAELGFVVIVLDGRGTPNRSQEFIDHSYGRLENGSEIEDHIAAAKQLAERHPYIDIDRIGIFGYSGGGFGAARAIMAYPDFYKVAVAGGGNHDQSRYLTCWVGMFLGADSEGNIKNSNNVDLAANLKGKLLLLHGEMDDNVHPANTLAVANALIQHNKRFDMLIFPGGSHMIAEDAYVKERYMDYFVEHLLGLELPEMN